MKLFRFVLLIIGVASMAGVVSTFPIESSYKGRAFLAQRIKASKGADLFGDKGDTIGSPQMMIIDDPKAILPDSMGNARLVDQDYLDTHHEYPLQLQTVEAFGRIARLVLTPSFILAFGLRWWLRRRADKAHNPATDYRS